MVTASAAGLLTMIGAAPYSVTKHAAIGFAEWLSVTYGHRGIAVQAICPQGVQTRMLEQAGPLKDLLTRDAALTPEQVADAWVASLAEDRFLVLPHPEVGGYYAARAADPDAWLAGMRRLQAKVDHLTGVGLSGGRARPRPDDFSRWYDGERPGEIDGELSAELIAGGKSNLTYEVTDGSVVVDRAPPAARPRAGHRARHGPRVHRDVRAGRHRRTGPAHLRALRRRRPCSARRST